MDPMANFVKLESNPTITKYKLKWKLDLKKAVRYIMANCDATKYEEFDVIVEGEEVSTTMVWTTAVWARLRKTYQKKNNTANARMWDELVRIMIPKGSTHKEAKETFDSVSQKVN